MKVCPRCAAQAPDEARFCPACGTALPAAPPSDARDPFIGRALDGKFLIEELLGLGGMGRVYLATQLSLDKKVCVKVLHAGMSTDTTLVGRFHREARAASRLNHPNSITVIDFGQDASDGSLYLAMEYVAGKDLGRVIRDEFPLDEGRVVHIMDQVLSALADAHAAGIVHRDLKPENIMVSELRGTRDFVKVLDFGIAKVQEGPADPGLTQVGMVCGTPEYMSPEQARGEELDARSDLYAAGVILYQMVTANLPFSAPTAMGIVTKHLTEPPIPPSKVDGVRVSSHMENVILRALSKSREGRPTTALAMQQELNAVLAPQVAVSNEAPIGDSDLFPEARARPPTAARPGPAPATQPEKPAGGRKFLFLVVGLVLLAGVGAGLFLWLRSHGTGGGGTDAAVVAPLDAGMVSAADAGPAEIVEPPAPADAGQPGVVDGGAAGGSDSAAAVPQAAEEFYTAGREMMARSQTEKAVGLFGQALKLHPGYAAAHRALGMCHMRLGNLDKAKEHFSSYLKLVPHADDVDQIRRLMESL